MQLFSMPMLKYETNYAECYCIANSAARKKEKKPLEFLK